MTKRNILHIITKLELGGAQQNTLYNVLKHDRSKYNVFLVSGAEGLLVEEAKNIPETKVILLPGLIHKISLYHDFICFLDLIDIFKKEKIDLVHTHSSKAGLLGRLAAKIAGVPVIIHTIHGFSFNDFQNPFKKKLFTMLERFAAKFTDKLIVVSATDTEKGVNAKVGQKEKYTVIRSGFNLAEFKVPQKQEEVRREFNIPKSSPVVGMVACLKPQKNPLDFVRMAALVKAKLPETRFILAGDGELRPAVEKLIEENNLKNDIILTGWRQDVAKLLYAFDVLVLTSLFEGLPRVLPQAMCAKLPLVATAVDGSKEAIKNGVNGYLVKPKDPVEMAEKVCKLLTDEALRKMMGEAGYARVAEWDQDEMVRQIEAEYEKLMTNDK